MYFLHVEYGNKALLLLLLLYYLYQNDWFCCIMFTTNKHLLFLLYENLSLNVFPVSWPVVPPVSHTDVDQLTSCPTGQPHTRWPADQLPHWSATDVDQLTSVPTHCIMALVLRVGSSGRKFLYSSTSFSIDSSWDCSLLRRAGSVSRMWLVSCWLSTRWR